MTMSDKGSIKLQRIKFPPSQLALIAPDLSLQKYLQSGFRPSLRKFEEFKPVITSSAGIGRYDGEKINNNTNVLGSSVIKSGCTNIICSVSASITEDEFEAVNDYRVRLDQDIVTANRLEETEEILGGLEICKNSSVNAVVEIAKGVSGPPTEEEMSLGQELYETILHSGLLSRESLRIKVGLKSVDKDGQTVVINKDNNDDDTSNLFGIDKKFSFVLHARLQIFGRTGPLYDLCYSALVAALKNTKLPEVYLNERESELRVKSSKKGNVTARGYELLCDPKNFRKLEMRAEKIGWSSTFGVVDIKNSDIKEDKDEDEDEDMNKEEDVKKVIMLADLEGDAEDAIDKRISVLSGEENLMNVVIQGGEGNRITKECIKKALDLAKRRAKFMIQDLK